MKSKYAGLLWIVVAILCIIGSYKWQEWKLEHIWGIENPSVLQVIDSMGNKNKVK